MESLQCREIKRVIWVLNCLNLGQGALEVMVVADLQQDLLFSGFMKALSDKKKPKHFIKIKTNKNVMHSKVKYLLL